MNRVVTYERGGHVLTGWSCMKGVVTYEREGHV